MTAVGLMNVPVHTPTDEPRSPTSLTTVGKPTVSKPLTIFRQDFAPSLSVALDDVLAVRVELTRGLDGSLQAKFETTSIISEVDLARRKDIWRTPGDAFSLYFAMYR